MMESEACMFEIFPYAVKPARNLKRDLQRFFKKRAK